MILNCIDNSFALNKKKYLERAAKRLGIKLEDDGYILNIEPYEFKKGEKWTGIWEIDLLLDRQEMTEENWSQADAIFTAISDVPPRLQKFKTQLLFQACDPELHTRTQSPLYDVVFAGSLDAECYKERRRVYELIKQHFNFKQFEKTQNYINVYSLAKVQFIRSMKTPLGDGELAQRFFECLAIGPVLTNYVEDLKYTNLIEGQDYLAYQNDAEMLSQIDYLIKYPLEAQKIADSGRKQALLQHTYDNRLKTIYAQI